MWRTSIAVFVLAMAFVGGDNPSSVSSCSEATARELVTMLWSAGARGEFLSAKGWASNAGYFSMPAPFPENGSISIYSGRFGINNSAISKDGREAEVDVEFSELGKLTNNLQFLPQPPNGSGKTSFRHRLVRVPRKIVTFAPDGKTVISEKEISGTEVWQIDRGQNFRWATVDSAIRYVLEARRRTADPKIKKNADSTLNILLGLH